MDSVDVKGLLIQSLKAHCHEIINGMIYQSTESVINRKIK